MERQLIIITAMIDRLRRRWGLQRGQQRLRRYWVRLWLSQAECEEEGQYTRLMSMLELDDPMAYQNFIRMPHELSSRAGAETQPCDPGEDLDERHPESRTEVGGYPETLGQWRQLPSPSVCFQDGTVDHQ